MMENFNFKNHGIYDVSPIIDIVNEFNDEWLLDTSRQELFAPHMKTQTFYIFQSDLDWKVGTPFFSEKKSKNIILNELVETIVLDLEQKQNGKRGQVLLIKLFANEIIPDHKDSGDYLVNVHRNHIPIITSDKTFFGVGNELINMNTGECWEINNTKTHSVENISNTDRIHLLIDIMPNELIIN